MKYNRYFYLLITGIILITACDDDDGIAVPVPEPEPPRLTELPGLDDFNRRAYDIQLYEDRMLIQGEFRDFHYRADTSRQQFVGRGITLRADGVSSSFRAFTYATGVDIRYISPERSSRAFDSFIALDSLGSDSSIPVFSAGFRKQMTCISEDGHLLLPYYNDTERQMYFATAKIEFPDPAQLFYPPQITNLRTFRLDVPDWQIYTRGVEMLPVEDGFLLLHNESSLQAVYRIDYDGTYEQVFDENLEQTFYFQDELYGIRTLFPNFEIYRADADGRNWRQAYTILNEPNNFFRFFPVGDDLFVQNLSSGVLLIVTELTEDDIRLQAVDTPQLDSRTITDMANFLGNTYISTLSGTFRQEAISLRDSRRE